jgi:hypothetical protein
MPAKLELATLHFRDNSVTCLVSYVCKFEACNALRVEICDMMIVDLRADNNSKVLVYMVSGNYNSNMNIHILIQRNRDLETMIRKFRSTIFWCKSNRLTNLLANLN